MRARIKDLNYIRQDQVKSLRHDKPQRGIMIFMERGRPRPHFQKLKDDIHLQAAFCSSNEL